MTVKPELYHKNLFRVKSACNLISRPDPDRIVKNRIATIVELVEQRQAGIISSISSTLAMNLFQTGGETMKNWIAMILLKPNLHWATHGSSMRAFDFMRILNLDLTGNLTT